MPRNRQSPVAPEANPLKRRGTGLYPEWCRTCPFRSYGTGFCPDWWPTGNEPALLFVLEAPGQHEILTGKPLTGATGMLWENYLLKSIGLSRDEVAIANTIRCRPPQNKYPTGELGRAAFTHCRHYDSDVIHRFNPELCVVSLHPAVILRDPSTYRLVENAMQKALRLATTTCKKVAVLMGEKALKLFAPWMASRWGVRRICGHFFTLDRSNQNG